MVLIFGVLSTLILLVTSLLFLIGVFINPLIGVLAALINILAIILAPIGLAIFILIECKNGQIFFL